jgi:hypothetical protein
VRKYCPECRLVFPNADLFFGHPDFSSDLRGSIVGSTYPLFSKNQSWSYPFSGGRAQRVFTNNGEHGYFNAVIALLHPEGGHNLLEYGPPFPEWCPQEADRHCPPVWISVVGQGGFSPVTAVAATDGNAFDGYLFRRDARAPGDGGERRPRAELVPGYPTLWIVAVLGVALLLGNAGYAYARAAVYPAAGATPGGADDARGLLELFRPRADSRRRGQRFYVFVCLSSCLATFAFLGYVWLIPHAGWILGREYPVRVSYPHRVAPAVIVLLTSAFALLLLLRATRAVVQTTAVPPAPPADAGVRSAERKRPRYLARVLGQHRVALLCLILLLILTVHLAGRRGQSPSEQSDDHLVFLTNIEPLFFFERATNLTSGVSPAMSVVLLGFAFYLWGYVQLKRLAIRDRWRGVDPFPPPRTDDEKSCLKQLAKCRNHLEYVLVKPRSAFTVRWAALVWLALAFVFCRIASRFTPAVDGIFIESVLLVALAGLAMLIVSSWMYLRKLWGSTRDLLVAVTLLPLHGAFQRIPRALTQSLGPYLSYARDGRRQLLNQRARLYQMTASDYAGVAGNLSAAAALPPDMVLDLKKAMTSPGDGARGDWETFSVAARALLRTLLHVRRNPALAENLLPPEPRAEDAAEHAGGRPAVPSGDAAVRHWLTQAEDFVALEVTVYLSQFFVQLRNLTLFLSFAPMLLLLAVSSYVFQPQRAWLLLAGGTIALMTFFVIRTVTQIERDELISRIQKTTPDRLNLHWAFLSHVALYAAPLLGVLVAVSSSSSDLLHTWLDPLLQIVK